MELNLHDLQGWREAGAASTSQGQVPAWLSAVGLAALPLVAWSQYSLFQTGDLLSFSSSQPQQLLAAQQLMSMDCTLCCITAHGVRSR